MSTSETKGKAQRYLRKMSFGARAASNLESVSAESFSAESLTGDRAQDARDRAAVRIERESAAKLTSTEREELDQIFLKDGMAAMDRLKNDGEEAVLSDEQVEALEAIVETDGSRPALMVSEDDEIQVEDDSLGQWKDLASEYAEQISQVAAAVGRIDLDGQHRGTGFVVKRGVILTNRHVLQELATEDSPGNWTFKGEPSITFDADPGANRTRQFKLKKEVLLAGDQRINPQALDFNKLDFAVLECELPDQAEFPEPLPLETAL